MELANSGTRHCKAKAGKGDRLRETQNVKMDVGLEMGGEIQGEKGG